ncbi:MAG TPA: Gmad2 immunoglobulin-like domain-containing protein [Candidatus Microsaccharimonas sp.]|jgi:Tfp pilus assembly protein PilX
MKDFTQKLTQRNRGNALPAVILTILMIALVGLVFYGTYNWQHTLLTDQQQQVTQLKQQLADAKKQNPVEQAKDETTYISGKGVAIKVYTPAKGAKLSSPLVVLGEVPGNWSFEASFPVSLKDSSGTVIAKAPAQVLGDWMTTSLVPFSISLPYTTPASGDGVLILQKDNPSGLAQNDDSISIPITL